MWCWSASSVGVERAGLDKGNESLEGFYASVRMRAEKGATLPHFGPRTQG